MEPAIRRAEPEDLEKLIRLATEAFSLGPTDIPIETAFSHLMSKENARNFVVMERDGALLSMVGSFHSTIHLHGARLPVASIGAVCTGNGERGKGFASSLLRWMEMRLGERGTPLMLVSGTLPIYTRSECFPAGEQFQVLVAGAGLEINAEQLSSRLCGYQGNRLKDLMKVYTLEPVRFERSSALFETLLRNQPYLSYRKRHPDTVLLYRAGAPVAYAVAGGPGASEREFCEITEFGGADEDVLELLQQFAKQQRGAPILVNVPSYRRSLAQLLASRGARITTGPISGTIKIIDFLKLWSDLKPLLVSRMGVDCYEAIEVERRGDSWTLSLDSQTEFLDHRAALNLVFSGPQAPDKSPLTEALYRAFPMPFVDPYNLNYI